MKHTVYEHKLKSGAQGLVIDVPNVDVVSIELEFNSGYMFWDRAKFDAPHILEHILAVGKNYSTEMEKNGAYNNALTNRYVNSYVVECAAFEVERIIQLLTTQLARPEMTPELFRTETGNVRQELSRNTSNYGRIASTALAAKLMPLGSMMDEDRLEALQSISYEDVLRHYQSTHTHKNLRFFIAGDFRDKGKSIVEKLEKGLASLPEGARNQIQAQPFIKLDRPIYIKKPIKQIYYDLQIHGEPIPESEEMALLLLSSLLTSGHRSWVYGEVRNKGLAYHAASNFSATTQLSLFRFSAFATAENIAEVFKIFAKHFQRALRGDFPTGDLKATQQMVLGRMARNRQTAGSLIDWYGGFYSLEDKIQDLDDYMRKISKITKDQVVKAANNLVSQNYWGLSLVGDVTKQQAADLYEILTPIWDK